MRAIRKYFQKYWKYKIQPVSYTHLDVYKRQLLKGVMEELKNRGYQAVHLLVAKDNVKALRSYDKLNFENVGAVSYTHLDVYKRQVFSVAQL